MTKLQSDKNAKSAFSLCSDTTVERNCRLIQRNCAHPPQLYSACAHSILLLTAPPQSKP